MTDNRAWEEASRKRLERAVSKVVSNLRSMADQIERDSSDSIAAAWDGKGDYGRVAQQVVHEITWGIANTNLGNVIDAATDTDKARTDRHQS